MTDMVLIIAYIASGIFGFFFFTHLYTQKPKTHKNWQKMKEGNLYTLAQVVFVFWPAPQLFYIPVSWNASLKQCHKANCAYTKYYSS